MPALGSLTSRKNNQTVTYLHLSSCLLPADYWISRIYAMSTEPPPPLLPGQLRQPRRSECYLHTTVIRNIHVVRTPPVCTAVRHTCCQGQTSGLTGKPDRAG